MTKLCLYFATWLIKNTHLKWVLLRTGPGGISMRSLRVGDVELEADLDAAVEVVDMAVVEVGGRRDRLGPTVVG
jgi:hypothetical protein